MLIRNKITKFAIENNAELFYRKAAGAPWRPVQPVLR